MKTVFNTTRRHNVTEANINYYATPFIHPKRKMAEYDFIYMLKGKWKIGQNDEEYELTEDTLLILSANNTHYGVEPCSPDSKTMYFHLSYEEENNNENDQLCEVESLTYASHNRNIKKYFYEIVNAKLCGNHKKANIFFDLLMYEIDEAGHQPPSVQIGEQIKNIIHKNPERFLSNKELAQKTHVSVKTAENKFKTLFGVTIHQYTLKFKVEQAIAYFKNFPEMSIKEVAYNLGFYDEYHFSKQFKKVTGFSPNKYRKEILIKNKE
ncbi:MAG: AraC family transcriptional regulator [Acutalibacteraceae bacterium]|nr:AraC family transcriptional regulator [Acutalibacteraceae bacterium]